MLGLGLSLGYKPKGREAVYNAHLIGIAGELGFGVGAIPADKLPVGFNILQGHYEKSSVNYGNVVDPTGSVMVAIPKFYFKIIGNNIKISSNKDNGFVLNRMFINAEEEVDFVLVDKYTCGNLGGVFTSQFGLNPCSTSTSHNPIGNLNNRPANNYGGLYTAVKGRSSAHFLSSKFIYSALIMLAKAHSDAGTVVTCAFNDVAPYLPKGCNNNALADANDSSVNYAASGYLNCGKAGAITNFEKTTHNGQFCGVADLNGNMYEVASAFIRYNSLGFLSFKESTDIRTIMNDSTTRGAGGAYDRDLYEVVDLSDFINPTETGSWQKLGNADNQVFAMSTDRTSNDYKKTMLGIPNLAGSSTSGTTEFGNDGIYRYLRDQLACVCGLSWLNGSAAGAFAMVLYNARNTSGRNVGGRTSYLVMNDSRIIK
jgi:hypothetical protein